MIKKLLPYIKKYKKYIIMGCTCAGLESIVEMILPIVMANIVDIGITTGNNIYTLKMGALMIALAIISLILGIGSARFSSVAGQGIGAELRKEQYEKIQTFSFSNIEKFSTSSLITRLTTDINTIQLAVTMSMRILVRAPIMLISALIISIFINARLSLVFAVALPVLASIITLILSKVRPLFTTMQEKMDKLNLVIQENLIGIRAVKSYVRAEHEIEKFSTSNKELKQSAEKSFGFVVINMPAMQIVMFSSIIAIMWFGGHMVYLGSFTVGKLTSFLTYVTQILMSLMMLSMILMMVSRSGASLKRIIEVLEEEPDIVNPKTNDKLIVKNGDILFENVYFKYEKDGEEYTLENINLDIKSGQTIGILGSTGSAKTTLVQLIPRLYDVTSGRILVSGYDVRDYDIEILRNAVSMVLQKNVLFSGSIKENLKWGNENATDKEIEEACKSACADEFINRMPDGYETDLGQGGVNVSGGQKQRLCIARALLKNPKIIILDDSTSAVDTATDAKIREAFTTKLKDITKIIIAQRVNSICEADQIIVIDDGKIVDIGKHKELIERCEIYKDVYTSQQEGVGFDA